MTTIDQHAFNTFLDPDETILEVIHKHWFSLIAEVVKASLFGIITPLVLLWIIPNPRMLAVVIIWIIIGIGWVIYDFFDWYLDAIVLTDQNFLDIEWNGFFEKTANRINYEHLESASYVIKGVIATFFGFGDLTISTHNMGDKGLTHTRNVREMQKLVLNMRDKFVSEQSKSDTDDLKRALRAFIREGGMIEDTPDNNKKEEISSREIWVSEQKKVD